MWPLGLWFEMLDDGGSGAGILICYATYVLLVMKELDFLKTF